MSITDELREWAKMLTHWWYDPVKDEYTYTTSIMPPSIDAIRLDSNIIAIADRIDAEHEESIQREHESAYDLGYVEGMGVANKADMRAEYLRGKNDGYDEGWDAGFASADDWCAQHESEMAEHGWYRALDADKQPIKFDDEVEHNGVVAKVLGITFHGTTPPTVCIVRGDCWVEADELRHHHHAPTVEDVLTEFAAKLIERGELTNGAAQTIAEYAAKLKLAEGEDA